ncbi:MAG: hypothetical protein WA130_15125 [Candidatus Methanoperedens sp.]
MILNDSLLQNGTALLTNGSINLTVNVVAENLTGKLVTEASIWSQGLSILSLIIAFYSIYLSQLQGAKIKLVETPKIELVELQKEKFNNENIPSTLDLKKLDIFFINSGNRAGILKNVQAKIQLEEYAKLCLKEQASESIKYGNNSENNDFLIILDKSVGHVFIENLCLQAIYIQKGEPFGNFDRIQETQNLVEMIDKIFDIQRTNLKNLIDLIEKNHKLGNLKVSYKCTGRKYLFWEEIKNEKLDLKIEGKYIETVKNYRELLNNWNDLSPTNEEVISKLISFLDYRCKSMIEPNRDALLQMQGIGALPLDSYIKLLESFSFEYNLLKKWETSKLFSDKLFDLIEKMKDYTKIYTKVRINSAPYEEWNQCRMDLLSQCIDVFNLAGVIIDNLKIERANVNLKQNWIFRWS